MNIFSIGNNLGNLSTQLVNHVVHLPPVNPSAVADLLPQRPDFDWVNPSFQNTSLPVVARELDIQAEVPLEFAHTEVPAQAQASGDVIIDLGGLAIFSMFGLYGFGLGVATLLAMVAGLKDYISNSVQHLKFLKHYNTGLANLRPRMDQAFEVLNDGPLNHESAQQHVDAFFAIDPYLDNSLYQKLKTEPAFSYIDHASAMISLRIDLRVKELEQEWEKLNRGDDKDARIEFKDRTIPELREYARTLPFGVNSRHVERYAYGLKNFILKIDPFAVAYGKGERMVRFFEEK